MFQLTDIFLTLKTHQELIKLATWDSATNVFDPSGIPCKAIGKTAALCKLIKDFYWYYRRKSVNQKQRQNLNLRVVIEEVLKTTMVTEYSRHSMMTRYPSTFNADLEI